MYFDDVPNTVLPRAESYCRDRAAMWRGSPVADAYMEAARRMFAIYKERDVELDRAITRLLDEQHQAG